MIYVDLLFNYRNGSCWCVSPIIGRPIVGTMVGPAQPLPTCGRMTVLLYKHFYLIYS